MAIKTQEYVRDNFSVGNLITSALYADLVETVEGSLYTKVKKNTTKSSTLISTENKEEVLGTDIENINGRGINISTPFDFILQTILEDDSILRDEGGFTNGILSIIK